MEGYDKAVEIFGEVLENLEKRRDECSQKFLDAKNSNDHTTSHGYDMSVIMLEHSIECIKLGLRTLKLDKSRSEFDSSVHAHEETMKFMINNLTK